MNMPLILALITLLPAIAAAQEPKAIAWRDCQETALQHNPALASSRYTLESARYRYYASRNQDLPYPGLTASHSYSRSGSNYGTGPSDNFSFSLGASETLFSVRSNADLKLQLNSLDKADLDLRVSLASARADLLNSFVNLLYAQENIRVAGDISAIRDKNAAMIRLQYDSGMESKGNLMQSEALAEQARSNIAQTKRSLVSAQRGLASSLGMDQFAPLAASGTLAVPPSVAGVDVDAVTPSLPGLLSAKKTLEAAQTQLAQAGADIFPSLSATQNLGWSGNSELPGNRAWSLGLALSWPLFSNGPTYHKNNVASAKSQLEKARQDYRGTLLSAKANLQSALARLDSAIDTVRIAGLTLDAARQRHSEAEVQYLAGTLNFQNWQDVEQALVSAKQNYLSVLQDANAARAQVDNLLGVPLGD